MPHRLGHDPPEEPRPLAAADHHEPHRPVAGLDIGRVELRQHRGPHRVADVQAPRPRRQRRRPGAAGDHLDPRREAAVDPPEHAVLLVDQPRDLQGPRRQHRRQRRVAAEARDHRRTVAAHRHQRPGGAGGDRERGRHPLDRRALREGGGRGRPPLHRVREAAGVAGAAGVGGERHPPAVRQHLLGQRLRREHVPAGAAGGDDEVRRVQRAGPPNMSSISCCGRFRVSASSVPSPSAAAISDDPP